MDPKVGRFASVDSFVGVKRSPGTLNKYLYANADPVNRRDPTGFFAMGFSTAGAISVALAVITVGSYVSFVNKAKVNARLMLGTNTPWPYDKVTSLMDCLWPRDVGCRGDVPIFILGEDYKEHTMFVAGNANRTLHKSLVNKQKSSEGWYAEMPNTPCTGRTGGTSGKDCDEYPYFATAEGGPSNYPSKVQLEAVSIGDNRGAGAKLRWFFKRCNVADVGDRSKFFVATVPNLPVTGYICGR